MKKFSRQAKEELKVVEIIGGIILYMLAVSFVLGGGILLGIELFS